ncbi:MAG: glycosyltransferase family 2 protein [Candidatus Kapabacteria bacterium]|jgi:cellulose synthase/poly-beta-1,6-N-acetylglucosamine synthase-like glycosyltransferase|nr:glycosyltransferase family 2 protein [Candidatus Kapabacteria bacterium]
MENFILIAYVLALTVLFGFGMHGLYMLYYFHKTAHINHKADELTDNFPVVTVQLPMFNEMYVVERLIRAVCEINYPIDKLEIQVLDDSTDETVELSKKLTEEFKAKGYDIKHIQRVDRTGYKAGALKEGMSTARGEFIAIFDADFVPNEDFLMKTIPHFADEGIGCVQTRWEHLNEDYSMLTRAQALALDGHFVIEQQIRNKAGFFINFNGTAGVWRKTTIEDAGNWQADTLTEDLDLSYRAQLNGWKFIFLPDVSSPAELPADINALKTQQFRWTKGAIETAKKILPRVLKSNLSLKLKMECTVHLTSNIVFPFIIVVALMNIPIVLIKNQIGGLDGYYTLLSIFVLASASTFLFYMYAQRAIHLDWRRRILLFPIFLGGSMGFAVNNTKAVLEALFNIKTGFARTPKYKIETGKDKWQKKKYVGRKIGGTVYFELFMTLYFIVGIGISAYYMEIAAIPFQLLFLWGFGAVGFMSLKHALSK